MTNEFIGSWEECQTILQNAVEGILIAEIESKLLKYANPAICKMFGYSYEEMLGLSVREIHPSEQVQHVLEIFESQARGEMTLASEVPCKRKNGTIFLADINTSKMTVNEIEYNVGFFTDVTERKRSEDALHESEAKFRHFFEFSKVALSFTLPTGEMSVNNAFCNLVGYSKEELHHMKWQQLTPLEDIEYCQGKMDILLRGEQDSCRFTKRYIHKDGSFVWVDMSTTIFRDKGGKPLYFFATVLDITESRNVEMALRAREKQLAESQRIAQIGSWEHNYKRNTLFWSDEMFHILGLDPKKDPADFNMFFQMIHPGDQQTLRKAIDTALQQHIPFSTEYRFILGDGSDKILHSRAEIIPDESGNPVILSGTVQDVTESKRAEEALRQSNENFFKIIQTTPDIIGITRLDDGTFLEVNQAFTDLTGYTKEELRDGSTLPGSLGIWTRKEDRDRFVAELQGKGKVVNMETTLRMKNGTIRISLLSARFIEMNGATCVLTVARDITEQKKTQALLINAQRLESLGILAGGIAHDFNNLLTGFFANIDMARLESKDANITEYLDAALASMRRAKALTQQLLTFSKGGVPAQKITPLIPFVEETTKFALSGSNILCRISLDENLWPCNIDKDQIGQVIDNIVINAQQAMPSGGTIEIKGRNITFYENEHSPLSEGKYVKLSFKDHGIGIPKEILPRIFDPFYTTKTKRHGLGLATSYSIIDRHGGCIEVESEPGTGSTFHVYLPAGSGTVTEETARAKIHRGSGTIIVVDDEEAIRIVLSKMLALMGYTVACKANGREAIDFYAKETRAGRLFAAILFDLTLPGGMGGIEAVAEIRKLNRKIPVFAVSGYADNSAIKNPSKYGFTAGISKPFTLEELSEMLNIHLKT